MSVECFARLEDEPSSPSDTTLLLWLDMAATVKQARELQVQLAAVVESTIYSIPSKAVLLCEFIVPGYRHSVIDAVARKHGIGLYRLDSRNEQQVVEADKNLPLFIDVTAYDKEAWYWDYLSLLCKSWVAKRGKAVFVFVPYVSKESHSLYEKYTGATCFAIDKPL